MNSALGDEWPGFTEKKWRRSKDVNPGHKLVKPKVDNLSFWLAAAETPPFNTDAAALQGANEARERAYKYLLISFTHRMLARLAIATEAGGSSSANVAASVASLKKTAAARGPEVPQDLSARLDAYVVE